MIEGDILKEDWSDADIIFVASVCLPEFLIEAIADQCAKLKSGTRILFMNTLPARPYLTEKASWKGYFTWGLHIVRLYIKK